MGDLVLFENDMNKLQLGSLSKTSMNIFMTLCQKMKNMHDKRVTISFSDIKEKSGYAEMKRSNDAFISDVNGMVNELLSVNSTIIQKKQNGKKKIYRFDLFPTFIIDEEKETLEVGINPDFEWLLNEFKAYTSLDLGELVSYKSKYTKNLFRLIRQWKGKGKLIVGDCGYMSMAEFNKSGHEPSIEEFRKKIGVKDSYSNKEMMRSCISVAVKEINENENNLGSIKNLVYETKYANKRGRPLSQIIFSWDAITEERAITDITNESIYHTVKAALKEHPEFNDDDITNIAREAKKNNLSAVKVKQRLNYATHQENVLNMVGYIITLMRKFNDPVELRNSVSIFKNFEERNYDFAELERMVIERTNKRLSSLAEKKEKGELQKFTDIIGKNNS